MQWFCVPLYTLVPCVSFLYGVNVYEFIPIVLFMIKNMYINVNKMRFLKLFYSYSRFL